MSEVTTVNVPQGDFVTSTLIGAITNASTSFTIGSGLILDANGGFLQINYDSLLGLGVDNGPETIAYTSYNSGTGAVTGVTRAQATTTAVAHANSASVQCGPSVKYSLNGTTLGYSQEISATVSTITAEADLSITVTVTVPAGGRRIKITAGVIGHSSVGSDSFALLIYEGATELMDDTRNVGDTGNKSWIAVYSTVPSIGSHTYKLRFGRQSGSGTWTNGTSATHPNYILVELI